ncbi:circadian clock protein KaiA [Chroococcidiopsis sp. FACHB-1243]|uniref:circadian clock protein KaiA n=1 Tax=Chroococcidiopsis sp. [FACHB-1243] TaxID=2692781 RepID=UPI00177A7F71|nr:circadian clock protein KaiA [Chroococcidiopsis sp. [FACHB-1243]]MBD2305108.1 circadian clock protein KaiA [Chroococcidiopsis sp. [FACHB-1243]]
MDEHHLGKRQSLSQQMTLNRDREFLQQLKADYCQILLRYFNNDNTVKQQIDRFINVAFDAKVPVPQIIEIHMELIDKFSKQLKLEGRNDEVLLDYRLTLIDILAHLCEIYRTSIS